jgi:hypothetical protein
MIEAQIFEGDISHWLQEERDSSISNSKFNNLGCNIHWSLGTLEA